MIPKKKEYEGFILTKSSMIRTMPYFEFSREIRDVLVRQRKMRDSKTRIYKERPPRVLLPVMLTIMVRWRRANKRWEECGFKIQGHPNKQWHPHIVTREDGADFCWGGGWDYRVRDSKSLQALLDGNLMAAIGVLADFTHGGYNFLSRTRKVWTVPVSGLKKTSKHLEDLAKVESFPVEFWKRV